MKRSATSTLLINGQAVSLRGAAPNLGAAGNRLGTVYATAADLSGSLAAGSLNIDDGSAEGTLNLTTVSGRTGFIKHNSVLVLQFTASTGDVTCYKNFTLAGGKPLIFAGGPSLYGGSNILDVRSGISPQTINIYGSYTNATNYERLRIAATAGQHVIAAEHAGTGLGRSLGLQGAGGIYFNTGSITTTKWFIRNNAPQLNPGADATTDIGESAYRIRNIHIMGDIATSASRMGIVYASSLNASVSVWVGTGGALVPQSPSVTRLTQSDGVNQGDISLRNVYGVGNVFLGNGSAVAFGSRGTLRSERPNSIAVRNGIDPQEFEIYATHTDAINYERLRSYYDAAGYFCLATEKAGTGIARNLRLLAGTNLQLTPAGEITFMPGSGVQWRMGITGDLTPNSPGTKSIGTTAVRVGNYYGVAGDFSGSLTATGLPTADPLVAGQIWNDLGTLKISAG